MIVFHPTLVAAPPAAEPLNYPTLGWNSVVPNSTITASSADPLFPVTNLANPATHLYWKAASTSPLTAQTIDFTVNSVVDYVAIAGHNFGTAGITVTIQEGAGHTTLMTAVSPSDDAPLIYRFVPASKTEIRIAMSVGTQPARISVVYVGKLTVFERGTQGGYTPLTYGLVNNVVNGESESGNFLGRIVTGARVESKASFKWLSPTWFRQYLAPFLEASVNNPFFFAWQPVDWPQEVGYAWLATDPTPILDDIGYAHIELEMTGIVS